MRLAVPKEIVPGEKRVALVPEVIPQLLKLGHTVSVESGAGMRAGFMDEAYSAAGASIAPDAKSVYSGAEMILKVLRPAALGPEHVHEHVCNIGKVTTDCALYSTAQFVSVVK